MKERLISALGGLVVLFTVLFFFDTPLLNLAASAIAVLAVYEVLHATKCLGNGLLTGASLLFAGFIPFFRTSMIIRFLPAICYLFILTLFGVLLKNHSTMRVEQVGFMFFICLIIPFALSTVIYMRDRWGMPIGLFYTVLSLCAAWLADTGAYFCGRFFGKRKLSPLISPKKTVEGAIGGAVVALLGTLLGCYIYTLIFKQFLGVSLTVNYGVIALVSPFLTVAGTVGDLSASVIKRQSGVKDFGHIMPGHGGVMDRFDSVLFVIPAVFILSHYLPLVTLS